MPKSKEPRRFGMVLFPGFSNLCLANAVEPLRAANTLSRAPLYTWDYLALAPGGLHSSSGLAVQAEPLSAHPGGAYLFVMPSYGYRRFDSGANRAQLRRAAQAFQTLVGLDSGSWLLASAGLLDGYRATAHWDLLVDLAEGFPDVAVTEDRYVIDRNRASCGGATTTLDLMLDLIEGHHGAVLALEVAALFMHGERDPHLDPRLRLPPDRLIRAAAALMRRHVETPLNIGEIASGVGLGQRALEGQFRKAIGQSPAQLYRRIRLAEARRRVEQTRDSIAEIALRCGYADPTAMTRAFRAEYGQPPAAIRRDLGQGDTQRGLR